MLYIQKHTQTGLDIRVLCMGQLPALPAGLPDVSRLSMVSRTERQERARAAGIQGSVTVFRAVFRAVSTRLMPARQRGRRGPMLQRGCV